MITCMQCWKSSFLHDFRNLDGNNTGRVCCVFKIPSIGRSASSSGGGSGSSGGRGSGGGCGSCGSSGSGWVSCTRVWADTWRECRQSTSVHSIVSISWPFTCMHGMNPSPYKDWKYLIYRMNEKPHKCTACPMFQCFFPSLRGLTKVRHHSFKLSLKYLQYASAKLIHGDCTTEQLPSMNWT